uniref:DUF7887 domain-containing protein n=1 Tax=Tetraselmis chuii TaxID=63592 RepID=A0A7S1SQN9_9CHLO|mmetsp:Transcript_24450/g.43515  ORF Transcript_24450/g.43515 Transcript_24450/m.43515 type:complete len:186 (+) Transcript_24450:296-853(+)
MATRSSIAVARRGGVLPTLTSDRSLRPSLTNRALIRLASHARADLRAMGVYKSLLRRPGRRIAANSTKNSGGEDGATKGALPLAQRVVASPLYSVALQGAVFVFLLGLVDAAYSGDWSRIGAISIEEEQQLQRVCAYIALFHSFCTPLAAVVARGRGLSNWALLTLKVAAVGGLALFEVLLTKEE